MGRFAYQTGVDLHIAQQDVVLTYALERVREESLDDALVFKGGTYVRKMILGNQGRFSMDLDYTLDHPVDGDLLETLLGVFGEGCHGVAFEAQDDNENKDGVLLIVRYRHDWDEGTFKLNVSTREPVHLPVTREEPVDQIYFDALPFEPPRPRCMHMVEALAEKLRALQQRDSERDYYDIIQYGRGALPEPLVRYLAAVKLRNVREAFDSDDVLQKLNEGRRDWSDLRTLVGKNDSTDWNAECRKAAERFAFLSDLTDGDRRVIKDRYRKELDGEIESTLGELMKAS